MPTRTQQFGLIIALGMFVAYVLLRIR